MNLLDIFSIPLIKTPDKIALEFVGQVEPEHNQTDSTQLSITQTYTYRELFDRADRLAAGFAAWGLKKGDRVAFFMGNRPEFVIAYLAIIRLGAILVPINLRYRRLEISHILDDCAPRLLLTERESFTLLDEAGVGDSSVEKILSAEEFSEWYAEHSDAMLSQPAAVVDADDLAMILYTSGTTGRSKGAMISHNNVLATVTGLLSAWGWEADDRLLLCLPLFHTHGLMVGLHCALAAGATVLLRAKYTPKFTLGELLGGAATLFFAVPTIYTRLVQELRTIASEKTVSRVELSGMRLFCSGSAPLDPETFQVFQTLTGHAILERYGMTETGMNLSNPYAGARLPGTVGTPLPGVSMRIVDGNGEEVAAGEEGELLVRGSNVFRGYWRDPEKSAASFSQDEYGMDWFHTGDLARCDPATGYVTLLGRKHELIISGGFNIYPREIEELLLTCPGVMEVAVVGRPDPEWGECPVAYLVCSGEVADEALFSLCRAQLASFKTPKAFMRVESLPRNAMGKLQKHLLD